MQKYFKNCIELQLKIHQIYIKKNNIQYNHNVN
jgi:hypothetical protein